ncbi:MAG: right-handed parallel beta-helix repeat-containing protein, partial [Thermoplasmatales archaeon]|nr:right-handed parallel beta-helix repeat-containing protein [Thermoplasmatales archaeon]
MAKSRSKDRIYITHLTIVIAGRKKKVKRIIPILVILLLLSSGFVGVSVIPSSGTNVVKKTSTVSFDGNTLYVGGSGSGNYTKIQDAIDNASEGDTVFVFSGTYFGHININKSINLIGENKNTTFITGFLAYTISIVADWVNISGFTIQNDGRSGEGVRIDSCYNNFINNIIDTPNDNIRISGDYNTISGNTITGDSIILSGDSNTISGNTISNNDDGIYLTDSCDNIISSNSFFNSGLFISEYTVCNNIVTNNTMNGKPLVYVYDESDLVLDVDAGQIILVNCTNITVQNQEIFNTTVGIQIWGSNTCFISGNTIAGNHYGICINGWNNTINDNTITNNNY